MPIIVNILNSISDYLNVSSTVSNRNGYFWVFLGMASIIIAYIVALYCERSDPFCQFIHISCHAITRYGLISQPYIHQYNQINYTARHLWDHYNLVDWTLEFLSDNSSKDWLALIAFKLLLLVYLPDPTHLLNNWQEPVVGLPFSSCQSRLVYFGMWHDMPFGILYTLPLLSYSVWQ